MSSVQSEQVLLSNLESYFNKESQLKKDCEGISRHFKLKNNTWGFTSWNKGTVSFNPTRIIEQNEKLLSENLNDLLNGLNTTTRPKKFEPNENVILIQGIKESIDRDLGTAVTVLDWCGLGSSATAEAESQTDLQAEFSDTAYARKVFSSVGSTSRINQTMKLGMLWDESSFDAVPVTIREAGIFWHLSASLNCHARVVSTDFVMDTGDLFVVQINELQENGTL
jgi:hypothetical protein